MIATDAYCGPPPLPATLASAWNLDPLVLAPLAALALLAARRRDARLWAAAGVGALVFVSPLCALASALFSARVAHHMALVAVLAPLLVLALPRPALPGGGLAALLHAALLWLWHAPGPYAWALSGDAAYWLMELTLLASALWLWGAILDPRRAPGPALGLAFATMAQMGALGAILVFAAAPLHPVHALSAPPFGLSPLEDQQLAGVLMWAFGGLPFAAAALWRLLPLLAGEAEG